MDILSWVLFGLLVGIITHAIDPHQQSGGLAGAILLGVSGSLLGGFIANMAFDTPTGGISISSYVIAVAGALLLLSLGRTLRKI